MFIQRAVEEQFDAHVGERKREGLGLQHLPDGRLGVQRWRDTRPLEACASRGQERPDCPTPNEQQRESGVWGVAETGPQGAWPPTAGGSKSSGPMANTRSSIVRSGPSPARPSRQESAADLHLTGPPSRVENCSFRARAPTDRSSRSRREPSWSPRSRSETRPEGRGRTPRSGGRSLATHGSGGSAGWDCASRLGRAGARDRWMGARLDLAGPATQSSGRPRGTLGGVAFVPHSRRDALSPPFRGPRVFGLHPGLQRVPCGVGPDEKPGIAGLCAVAPGGFDHRPHDYESCSEQRRHPAARAHESPGSRRYRERDARSRLTGVVLRRGRLVDAERLAGMTGIAAMT
jgi:hypothetical protein